MIKIIIELSKDETLEYTPEDAYTVYRELRRVFERGSLSALGAASDYNQQAAGMEKSMFGL